MKPSISRQRLGASANGVFGRFVCKQAADGLAAIPSGTRGLRVRRTLAPKVDAPIAGTSTDSQDTETSRPSQAPKSVHETVSWDEIQAKIAANTPAARISLKKTVEDRPKPPSKIPKHVKPAGRQSIRPPHQYANTFSDEGPRGPAPKDRDYMNISSAALSQHWDSLPPTPEQLEHASTFFRKKPCRPFIWSAPKFATMARGSAPEVCFLGRSNVGKSSLLNALLGGGYANVSSKPGRTKMMNAFEVGNNANPEKNLVVLDMPGYGKGGHAEWGKEILKYLGKRRTLRRAYVLIDSEVGLKDSDRQLLAIFRKEEIPHQIVLSKVDKLLFQKKNRKPSEGALNSRLQVLSQVFDAVRRETQTGTEGFEDLRGAFGEILASSSERPFGQVLGIEEVRHSMLAAAGLELGTERKKIKETVVVPFEEVAWKPEV